MAHTEPTATLDRVGVVQGPTPWDAAAGSSRAGVAPTASRSSETLLRLSLGNFVVGTGMMITAGLTNIMAADLGVTPAAIGQLLSAYGLAVGLGAPVLAMLTRQWSRRTLLVGSLGLFSVGHVLAALAPGYGSLLLLRVLSGLGAAVFTPQAAATAGVLVSPERRGRAVALVFLGFSVASVLGNPLGIVLGAAFGWRSALGLLGLVAAATALWLRPAMPRSRPQQPLARDAWLAVVRDRRLSLVLLTTILLGTGQFALVTYLAVIFAEHLAAGPHMQSLLFAWFGVFGVFGNWVASVMLDRYGSTRVVNLCTLLMLGGLSIWPLTQGSLPCMLLSLGLWGLGCFSSNGAQQSRLVALAPPLAPVSVALNSSGFCVGQAAGAAVGGVVLSVLGMHALSWVGVGLLALAFVASRAAARVRDHA